MSIVRGFAWPTATRWLSALAVLAVLSAAMLAACADSTADSATPAASPAAATASSTVTADVSRAAAPGTPLVATADPSIDAGRLFAANCARCHGGDMKGTADGPSLLDRAYLLIFHPDEEYIRAVLEGVPAHHWEYGDMPRIEGLSRADAIALTAHIRAAQRSAGLLR